MKQMKKDVEIGVPVEEKITSTKAADSKIDNYANENEKNTTTTTTTTLAKVEEIVVDKTPPVPGFFAAMTLEQYREMAKHKTYLKGTIHAKDKEEADAENKDKEDKASRGWWSCQSYKCDGHMNPKMIEKCQRCGAMKSLAKQNANFKHRASDSQIAFNANKR